MATEPRTHRLHADALSSFRFVALLCFITIVGVPLGLSIRRRATTSRVVVDGDTVFVRSVFVTQRFRLAGVRRVGLLSVHIAAAGLAGHYARKKVGGDAAIHLCFRDERGKSRSFIVSMFEDHAAIVAAVGARLARPVEQVSMGVLGHRWAAE